LPVVLGGKGMVRRIPIPLGKEEEEEEEEEEERFLKASAKSVQDIIDVEKSWAHKTLLARYGERLSDG
jgi:hypothetical protein